MTPEKRRRSEAEAREIRADAQLTIGLNHLRQGHHREALAIFDAVLEETSLKANLVWTLLSECG